MTRLILDESVLRDPVRLAAVARARRDLPASATPLDAIATSAARLVGAPMGVVTLVGGDEEHFVGAYGMPDALTAGRSAVNAYSVCKYVVSTDHPVFSGDMPAEPDPALCEHLLVAEFGVRAFLGVPVRDADDNVIGSLTVLDRAARQWSDDQVATLVTIVEVLRSIAGDVVTVLPPLATLDSVALLDGVQEAFLAVDADGVVVGWNHAAQDLLGFSAEEVCGRHLDASLLPDYGGQPIGAALARLFSAAPRRRVVRPIDVRHRDGHRLAAEASFSVVPAAGGPLACVFLTDRSGQAAAEDAAERSDGFLTALLDSLSAGVAACDHNGRVVLLNRALRDIQGMPLAGPVPSRYAVDAEAGLLHADLRPMHWQQTPLMRAFRGEHVENTDLVMRVEGQQLRTFSVAAQPIRGAGERLLGAVAVAHEVTAVRRVERFRSCHLGVAQALSGACTVAEAASGVLRTVATALRWPHAELWLIDEATDTIEPVGHWSAPGYRLDDLKSRTVVKGARVTGRVWQTGEPMWVPDLCAADLLTGPSRAEAEACLRYGLRAVLAVPVRAGGVTVGVLSCYAGSPEYHEDLLTVLLDGVAAQIGMFVALRRAEDLARQLTRAEDNYVALVGHELRTPLTSIIADVARLREQPEDLGDDRRAMVAAIERNATRLRDAVDTLLDLAGLDSGQVGLTMTRVDLTALVVEAVARAGPPANGVRLATDLDDGLIIDGDAERLRQVVDDLLSNAIMYSPDGGQVTVRVRGVGGGAVLAVTDEGIGTPPDERERIFERFYRASNVRQGTTGNGLGLSLAGTVVRLHGGTITLAARRPRGTIACVRLPCPAGRTAQGRAT